MDELSINLISIPEKSKSRRIIGLICLLLGLATIILMLKTEEHVPVSMYLMCIYLILEGIIFYLAGLGVSICSLYGEAHIRIDCSEIRIKKSIFSKECILFWDQIDRIIFSVICIRFRLKDGKEKKLDYNNLDYGNIQKIKNTIRSIIKLKAITA